MPNKNLTPFREVFKAEKQNVEKSITIFGDQIRNYHESHELLYSLNEHIGNQSMTKHIIFDYRDSVVLMISTRMVLSSKACFDLAMKGYYYDAEIIQRSLFENMCVIVFLASCEDKGKANENAKKWLNGELRLRTVKKELGTQYNKSFSKAYETMCNYAHSNFKAVKTLIKFEFAQGSINVSPKPIFIPKYAQVTLYPHVEFPLLYLLLARFGKVIEPNFGSQILNTLDKLCDEAKRLNRNITDTKT